jgi:hypothetical protein
MGRIPSPVSVNVQLVYRPVAFRSFTEKWRVLHMHQDKTLPACPCDTLKTSKCLVTAPLLSGISTGVGVETFPEDRTEKGGLRAFIAAWLSWLNVKKVLCNLTFMAGCEAVDFLASSENFPPFKFCVCVWNFSLGCESPNVGLCPRLPSLGSSFYPHMTFTIVFHDASWS